MLSLEFVSYLERFSLDYSVTEFDSSNKLEIIEILLKRSCPGAVVLSAKMAITYKIWNVPVWNLLLFSLVKLNMVSTFF